VLQFSAADGGPATPETLARAGEMLDYLHVQLDARRGRGGGDPLSLLVNDPGDDALTEQEVIGLCFLFLIAGPDTVTSATGFALYEMARAPELQLRLRSDESAIPAFIEELLRVASPVPFVPRKRTGEITFAGVTIPAGSECWLGLGAANRDTARFTEPSTIHLVQQTHFAFGRGPHRCLGSHLARLELQLIVEEWNRRIPEYALVSEPEIHWPNALLHFEEVRLRLGT
jgi:cytochrome P450